MIHKIVEELSNRMLWYDLALEISRFAPSDPKTALQLLRDYVIPNISRFNHKTLSDVVVLVCDLIGPAESFILVDEVGKAAYREINIIEARDYIRTEMTIRRFQCMLAHQQIDGCESFIFKAKDMIFHIDMRKRFWHMCWTFYEVIANYTEAMNYFLLYSDAVFWQEAQKDVRDLNKFKLLAEKLVKFGILTKDINHTTGMVLNPIYICVENADTRELVEMIRHGSVDMIKRSKKSIDKQFPGWYDFVYEKAELISFLNFCFYNESKIIAINDIMRFLKVSREKTFFYVLRVMGKGLITGKIDGEKDVVILKSMCPRTLDRENLKRIKEKYEKWAMRVDKMIDLL